MRDGESTRRTDHQLIAMLDEPLSWSVRGPNGKRLHAVASLREAMTWMKQRPSARVVAVRLEPNSEIIIFEGQLQRLALAV